MAKGEGIKVRVMQNKAAAVDKRQAVWKLCLKSDKKPLEGCSMGKAMV